MTCAFVASLFYQVDTHWRQETGPAILNISHCAGTQQILQKDFLIHWLKIEKNVDPEFQQGLHPNLLE